MVWDASSATQRDSPDALLDRTDKPSRGTTVRGTRPAGWHDHVDRSGGVDAHHSFPTGESRALTVHHSRLLQGLSVGDHVTVELNHEHAVIKLTKLPTDPAN